MSSLLPLKTCHLAPMPVSFCSIGAPKNKHFLYKKHTHTFKTDVVKFINCGISDLHFNILFTLLLKFKLMAFLSSWKERTCKRVLSYISYDKFL